MWLRKYDTLFVSFGPHYAFLDKTPAEVDYMELGASLSKQFCSGSAINGSKDTPRKTIVLTNGPDPNMAVLRQQGKQVSIGNLNGADMLMRQLYCRLKAQAACSQDRVMFLDHRGMIRERSQGRRSLTDPAHIFHYNAIGRLHRALDVVANLVHSDLEDKSDICGQDGRAIRIQGSTGEVRYTPLKGDLPSERWC